jgi:hypothetical protein
MGRTVRELLEDLDASELHEWIAFHAIDPWTEERADLRAGVIAATIANAHSRKGRFKPSDFMPRYETPKPRSGADLKAMAQRWNALLGGTIEGTS